MEPIEFYRRAKEERIHGGVKPRNKECPVFLELGGCTEDCPASSHNSRICLDNDIKGDGDLARCTKEYYNLEDEEMTKRYTVDEILKIVGVNEERGRVACQNVWCEECPMNDYDKYVDCDCFHEDEYDYDAFRVAFRALGCSEEDRYKEAMSAVDSMKAVCEDGKKEVRAVVNAIFGKEAEKKWLTSTFHNMCTSDSDGGWLYTGVSGMHAPICKVVDGYLVLSDIASCLDNIHKDKNGRIIVKEGTIKGEE